MILTAGGATVVLAVLGVALGVLVARTAAEWLGWAARK
jgi:hypothetical protein